MSHSAAHAAAIAKAIKASGVLISVKAEDFEAIIRRSEKPLVISATGGFLSTRYSYLTSYKGFAFFTKSPTPLMFSPGIEMIVAEKIWIPS